MLEGMQGLFVQLFFFFNLFLQYRSQFFISYQLLVFLLLQEGVCRYCQVFGIDFMVEIDGVVENFVQVVCYVFVVLLGSGGYLYLFFFGLENDGVMGDELVDGYFIGKVQFCFFYFFLVVQDRGGFGGIYWCVFFQQFL